MSRIGDFLDRLAEDADLLDRYLDDPTGTMQAEGLSNEEQELILHGTVADIRAALQDDVSVILYIIVRPHPIIVKNPPAS
jgi:hypothetical protein